MVPIGVLDDVLAGATTSIFTASDLAELVVLQRCCWAQEAIVNETLNIPALQESAEQVLAGSLAQTTLIVRRGHRLVASVRGRADGDVWDIGRLMVAPDLTGRGIGSALLRTIESLAPVSAQSFSLFTGVRSERNIRMYERAGYVVTDWASGESFSGALLVTKQR